MPNYIKNVKMEIPWDLAYKQLTISLHSFYQKNKKKSPVLLYNLALKENKLIAKQNWFKNTGTYNSKGIDPIQVYTSFSYYKSRPPFRIEMLNEWLRILKAEVYYQSVDFSGCPTPFALKILWGRSMDQQVEIWEEFSHIVLFEEKALKPSLLTKVNNWGGVKLTSFSIFLFWINCDKYISLDKNTISFLLKNKKDFFTPENLEQYVAFLSTIPTKLNKTLVKVAYNIEAIHSLSPIERGKLKNFIGRRIYVDTRDREINAAINFRIIGLKLLDKSQDAHKKSLKAGSYYFYKAYTFDKDKIKFDKNKVVDIYSKDGLKISLNAIVGKNGSGKSAISELLFMAVNNLYYQYVKDIRPKEFDWINDLKFEIFFDSYGIYQLVFNNSTVKAYEYISIGNDTFQKRIEEVPINKSFLEKFFYTISVNYSLYGLNSRHNREWLEKLFIKNDGYENPLVFEPNREDGNVNIHRQEELMRSRFLANTVEFVSDEMLAGDKKEDSANSFRYIRDKIELKNVVLSINKHKALAIYMRSRQKAIVSHRQIKGYRILISRIQQEYKLKNVNLSDISFLNNKSSESIALRYLVKKIFKIATTYSPYKENYWDARTENLKNIPDFIAKLKKDETHVTNKIRQTLNYLDKRIVYSEKEYSLDNIIKLINDSRRKYKGFNDNQLKTIDLLPPPIFNTQLNIKDNNAKPRRKLFPFEHLSSGERQQIYSLNSILYHLKNIDSIDFDERIQYRCVNLILDEVELYAHPEMQRTYIYELLKLINKTVWENLISINICFITHSPFILSDIPSERIMFLNQSGIQENDIKIKTFGANIHELLVDGFFLSNTIGEFALKNIKDIIDFHASVVNANLEDLPVLKISYNDIKDQFHYVLKNIGEGYIRGVLENHITDIEKLLNGNEYKMKVLKELENKIKILKKEINVKD